MEASNEQQVLSALQPSVNLTTEEREAIAMWTSEPPILPELTAEEAEFVLYKARFSKGQLAFSRAYARKSTGPREFPRFDAQSFKEFVKRRGDARAVDLGWTAGGFQIDQDNKAVFNLLMLYFTRDPRFEQTNPSYSLRKGIFLAGAGGVGKSILMELCDINPHASYVRCDCQEIAGEYEGRKDGGQPVIDHYAANVMAPETDKTLGQAILGRYFDDLGQEDTARYFGKDKNVMAHIIEKRYRAGQFNLTHFTSNHTLDELGDLYGPRVPDRLYEMCNVIEYPATAKSRRRSRTETTPTQTNQPS